ncbi:ribonuclease H1 N-terminal domain-containing protein [Pseudoscourfieldia marina]
MSSSHHGASAPPPPSQLLSLFLNPQPGGGGESSTYSLKRKREPDEVDEKKSTDLQDAQTLQARGKFRTFEEARTYVRELGLKSWREWWAWSKSGARPHDIPSHPETTYESSGWTSWGDFLGYAVGKQARKSKESKFRTFEAARTYVRTLGLKSQKEWHAWSSSGARPHDIPSDPDVMYKSSGWTSLSDFLGYAARSFRSFEDARSYVRTLGLKSWEKWHAWSKSGARPHDIPSNPDQKYKSSGWTSLGDFLGYAARSFRSFEDARSYVRTLGLKSVEEWHAWSSSGARPHAIPGNPETTYESSGWLSYGDFLGYAVGKQDRKTKESTFRTFEDARTYVHTLGLKSQKEWKEWSKSGARPHDIPGNPNVTYKSSGWISYPDFLGYAVGQQARQTKESKFRSFEDARAYVRTLGLKSKNEWEEWSSSGARPHDIPSAPDVTYASSGWTSWGDFLGYAEGKVANSFRTFEDARTYVRTLGLKSAIEWQAWSKSGARPHDIPSAPNVTYKSSGWTSWGDFLGYAVGKQARQTKESKFRTFEDARTYVRELGLKSWEKWKEWSSSGARPHDIPSHPETTYASSGWTSWGDFLGYAARSFRSFEDARTYVRTLGLKSAIEWQAWSASGARPHDIPGAPNVTYASSGWLSFGDFLGYAVGKSAVSTENVCIELIALPRSLKGEANDTTPPQISQRFIVFDTPMLEMRYAAMYVAQMLREEGSKGVNDGDIELRLLSGEVVSLSEQKIRDLLVFPKLEASSNSAAGSLPLLKVHYRHVHACVKEE